MSWIHRAWSSHRGWLSAVAIMALALVSLSPYLRGPVHWTPDGLFYQAQVYELQGMSQSAAIQREFSSQAASDVARIPAVAIVASRRWDRYTARFFRRRWLVPLMAAGLYPIAGERSLLLASILGYVVVGVALLALLRRRFSPEVSVVVAAACLLLSAVRLWSAVPLTDSWGLALEAAALLFALLALERGGAWIAAWVASMIALSFTRDATVVVLVAVLWVTLRTRTRRSGLVLLSGIAASLPAPVLFGAPLVQQLCFVFHSFHVPSIVSWSYVGAHYPGAAWSVVRDDVRYLADHALVSVVLLAATAYMVIAGARSDPFFMLARAALVGAVISLALLPNYTAMRLELVFVPSIAIALAFTARRLLNLLGSSRPRGLRLSRG